MSRHGAMESVQVLQSWGQRFNPSFLAQVITPKQPADRDILWQGWRPNVLSPRDLVFRPDLSDKNWTIIKKVYFLNMKICVFIFIIENTCTTFTRLLGVDRKFKYMTLLYQTTFVSLGTEYSSMVQCKLCINHSND